MPRKRTTAAEAQAIGIAQAVSAPDPDFLAQLAHVDWSSDVVTGRLPLDKGSALIRYVRWLAESHEPAERAPYMVGMLHGFGLGHDYVVKHGEVLEP